MKNIRPIAIYLPQYHPIPENDKAWGEGFTEWTNVKKAKPLFKGHYQPHMPLEDVGYYDLSDPEVLVRQAELANEYGIYGFAFYHYWFNGKRLLETPLDNMLKSGKPDFPFCYIWANENWTKRWDGADQEIIIKQDYSFDDDREHIHFLCKNVFNKENYIKISGKALFVVYKPYLLKNPHETAKLWRSVAAEYGIQLYLCHMVFSYNKDWQKLVDGFDAVIDFEPFGIRRNDIFTEITKKRNKSLSFYQKIIIRFSYFFFKRAKLFSAQYNIMEYQWMFENLNPLNNFPCKIYPSIVPSWDNTARRKNDPGLILKNSSPDLFEKWLCIIKKDFTPYSAEENFIFINAWNEWAEGNHLEPCKKWGYAYLNKVKNIFVNKL